MGMVLGQAGGVLVWIGQACIWLGQAAVAGLLCQILLCCGLPCPTLARRRHGIGSVLLILSI